MRFNLILIVISAALAGLAAYGFFIANEGDTYRILITAGSGLSLFVALGGLLALSSPNRGLSLNIRVISSLFFAALLIEHIIFSITGVRFTPYVIITGTLMVVYVLVCYLVIRALGKITR